MRNFILLLCIGSLNLMHAQISQPPAISVKKDSKEEFSVAELDSLRKEYSVLNTRSMYGSEEYVEDLKFLNKGLSYFPEDPYLYSFRGNLYMKFREFDKAIDDFTISINLTDNDTLKVEALSNRAAAKINKRDFEGGYNDLIEAYNIDPVNVPVLSNLGAVCDEIGKDEETLEYLKKAIEIDPDFYPAYGNIGFKYQEMGEHTKAIEYFNKVLEFKPNEPLGYSNRSFNKYKTGDLNGALADINKSLSIYPSNSYAYKVRALIYIEQGDMEKACDDINISLAEGYTKMYGDEVEKLNEKYCESK